jgi:hypothetical protein
MKISLSCRPLLSIFNMQSDQPGSEKMRSDLVIPGFETSEKMDQYEVASEVWAEAVCQHFTLYKLRHPNHRSSRIFKVSLRGPCVSRANEKGRTVLSLRKWNARWAVNG